MTLNEYLKEARTNGYAIGHFNFATEDVLRGIVEASRDAGAPAVMVGTSEGEADFFGIKEAVAVVRALRDDLDYPVFLNADHFKSFEKCKEAIDAGYDSIIIDAPKLPNEENIALTKQVADYARSVNPDTSVEGELGYLRGSSEVQQKIEISPADYSKP
ncbi:MAG: class II fructose-bisphosphate aldolase, partial [Candidatus Paceibacterota bacterium]